MHRLRICFLFFVLPILANAQRDGKINIGKIDTIWSTTLKEQRPYLIYTPPSYTDNVFLPQKYPVLYLLDGDAHFHSVTGLLQFLGTGINGNYVIPEMIVVAIPNTDRTRDLTPTHADKDDRGKVLPFLKTSGGNPGFFKFLKDELIPHIDSAYHTNSYRLLVGHSFGGITVINALYSIPETFNSYIAIDPSLWFDNQVLLKKAKNFFSTADMKHKFLFLGQANTLGPGDTSRNLHFESILQFNSILETFNTSGLTYQYKYYPSDDHGSVPLITEYDGLRFIFDGYKVNVGLIFKDPLLLKEHFKRFSEKAGATFLPPETLINDLGYRAMGNDTTLAIRFFQLNIDLYPDSFNVYDSMGEAWMAKGDFKKAIGYYEKSIAINPDSQHGKDMIKKMKEGKN